MSVLGQCFDWTDVLPEDLFNGAFRGSAPLSTERWGEGKQPRLTRHATRVATILRQDDEDENPRRPRRRLSEG